jgi:hypothetical protein
MEVCGKQPSNMGLNQGATIKAVLRKLEISKQTFHCWQHLYGGMKEPEMVDNSIDTPKEHFIEPSQLSPTAIPVFCRADSKPMTIRLLAADGAVTPEKKGRRRVPRAATAEKR